MASGRKIDAGVPNYPIESVDRALRLFTIFQDRPAISLSEAADLLDVSRSTMHRLLAMFVYHGFVQQDGNAKQYTAGPALLRLGVGVLEQMSVAKRARPVMEHLASTLGETIHLVLINGSDITFIDGIESTSALRVGLRLGVRMPAHATSSGKALLAELDTDGIRQLYPKSKLPTVTDRTLTTRAQLEKELERIREVGYATNDGESEPGLSSVAVAFRDVTGLAHTAIAVAAPSVRLHDADFERVGTLLRRSMTRISASSASSA